MIYTIRNEKLTVQISDHGAELQSIKDAEGADFTSATYLTEGDKTELSIHITADDWNAAYAGEYSDTVTFTVSYESK
jgi:hypothetical protein